MLEARRRIANGEPIHRFMVRADEQLGGYGRHGRTWHSPFGGVWVTLAWPLDDHADMRGIGLRAGIAALRVIAELLGDAAAVQLKWPNDVLAGGDKICGVLCERIKEQRTSWLLVGVGINANNDPAALPDGLRRPATSLARLSGRAVDADDVAGRLLDHLCRSLVEPLNLETLQWAAARLWLLDQQVRATTSEQGEVVHGTLMGLADDGRLVLETASGRATLPEGAELLGTADPARQ